VRQFFVFNDFKNHKSSYKLNLILKTLKTCFLNRLVLINNSEDFKYKSL
jgi:hypothetical protein